MPPRPAQIEELLEHREFVIALARTLTSDNDVADEIAQDTWFAAVTSTSDVTNSKGWLARVAVNFARQRARRDERRRRREQATARPETLPSTDEIAQRLELERKVVEAVIQLDDIYRIVIFHRFFEGTPAVDIAERLGLPVPTVRTRLRRAIEQLRQRLDRIHDNDRAAWALPLALAGTGAGYSTSIPGGSSTTPGILPEGGVSTSLATSTSSVLTVVPYVAVATTLVLIALLWIVLPSKTDLNDIESASATLTDLPDPTPGDTDLANALTRGAASSASADTTAAFDTPVLVAAESQSVGASVHGTIVDALREPLPGATVSAFDFMQYWYGAQHAPPLATSETDTSGQFHLTGLPFTRLHLIASSPGKASRSEAVEPDLNSPIVELGRTVLIDARPVTGVVRGTDDGPIEGAWILATSENPLLGTIGPCVKTSADGSFALDGVALTDTYLNVFAPEHATVQHGPIEPDSGAVELVLSRSENTTLRGFVREADGITPLAEAVISLTLNGDSQYPTSYYRLPRELSRTTTNAVGEWRIEHLPPGRYEVRVFATKRRFRERSIEVFADAGESVAVDFFASTGEEYTPLPMSGVLRNLEGTPLSNATINFAVNVHWTPEEVVSDAAGRFSLQSPAVEGNDFYMWLDDGTRALVGDASLAGYHKVTSTVGGTIDLAATPGGSLSGRVMMHDGGPAANATVYLLGDSVSRSDYFCSTATRADGSFSFVGLAPQEREIAIRIRPRSSFSGRAAEFVHPRRYTLAAGSTIEGVDVLLPAHARLSGRVVGAQGNPLGGVVIESWTPRNKTWTDATVTDRAGFFSLDRLPTDTEVILWLRQIDAMPNDSKYRVRLSAGEHRQDYEILVQPDPHAISGVVRFEDGSLASNVHVSINDVLHRHHRGASNLRGFFKIGDLPPGPLQAYARVTPSRRDPTPHFGFYLSNVLSLERGIADVEMLVDRTTVGTASGFIAEGSVVPSSARVRLSLPSLSASGSTRIIFEGDRFRMLPVPAGHYEAVIESSSFHPRELSFDIVAGAETDLGVIAFSPLPDLRGRVIDSEGDPVADAVVYHGTSYGWPQEAPRRPQPGPSNTTTGSDGRFEIASRADQDFGAWKEGYTRAVFARDQEGGELTAVLHRAGVLALIGVPPEMSNQSQSSRYNWAFRIEAHDPEIPTLPRWGSSYYGSRIDFHAVAAGSYTIHCWRMTDEYQNDPPPTPIPRQYIRFDTTVVPDETTTIDLAEHW